MIVDYTIVIACDNAHLIESAYQLIGKGWQPFGGICHTYERNIHREIGPNDINLPNDFEHYSQAFVKYGDKK